MGIDITAYKNLTLTNINKDDDASEHYWDDDSYISLYINPHFTERAEDIDGDHFYTYGDVMDVWSMSYGGYTRWRDMLARMAGYPLTTYYNNFYEKYEQSYAAGCWKRNEGPFYELINFSDCEGTIGTKTCIKLAKDFADFQEVANKMDEYFTEKYNELRAGFEFAADNGAIKFS